MKIEDFELMSYLHDAIVHGIAYEMAGDGKRTVKIRCRCHADAEYEPWNGKTLVITLQNAILVSHFLCGFTTGCEEISSWETSLSREMTEEVKRLQTLGINCSGIIFGIAFQTGSLLEGICREVDVEIVQE
jgi:hypothetical protein